MVYLPILLWTTGRGNRCVKLVVSQFAVAALVACPAFAGSAPKVKKLKMAVIGPRYKKAKLRHCREIDFSVRFFNRA